MDSSDDFSIETKDLSTLFTKVEKIGLGTYGKVYKCLDIRKKQTVALKKIKILKPNDGFPVNTVREIKCLKELKHDNIIRLRNVITLYKPNKPSTVWLSFDYCEFDLFGLLHKTDFPQLSTKQVLCYSRQLILAMLQCKQAEILHRDLKPANLFITRDNVLKIGDFGLARKFKSDDIKYTYNVITLYYRAPELILGCQNYQYEVDVWSVGCILYELCTNKYFFKAPIGKEIDQLTAIFKITGTPDNEEWPEFKELDKGGLFTQKIEGNLLEYLEKTIPPEFEGAADLISKMCRLTPSKRISMQEAFMHPFISRNGQPIEASQLPPISLMEMHQMQASAELGKNKKDKSAHDSPPRPEKAEI
ncbi:CMGC family protein kinase [Trichomonas vaginalis G3]|uniref:CMGC family protein kinase n=1 Tax=Trichomonas vaginalis (strain ATCC PRA-98 / G3) TaxID=412133 RepID=A2DCC2_TRIV3|nr:STKc CDK like domain-containing protein [Trichomonas vaginalis G3]EAY21859.1 CMGC family protein kinase [Trichomonas vaginalis G3]KAI5487667.1 STKc CDK like domain-containing protein [Trichomonas vaginalis G3]|eukprot:XP_001582845.1 CMGC family protein kinase [Trichomonas vaginalis G3]